MTGADKPADDPAGGPTARPGARSSPRSSPRDRARDEIVAGLDGRLRRTETVVSESADLLAQALPRIDDLGQRVGELTGRLDELAGSRAPAAPPNPPVCWPELTAEQARTEWERLAAWVATVLGPWYEPTRGQLPDCWARHRRAVLHLSWLRTAYAAAYAPGAPAHAAAEWHTRWLPAALEQVVTAIPHRWCRPGEHQVLDEHDISNPTRPAEPHEAGYRNQTVPLAGDPTGPRHWGPHFDQAAAADVAGREGAQQQQARAAEPGQDGPTS